MSYGSHSYSTTAAASAYNDEVARDTVARRFFVRGRVQGVGFRYFVERHAGELGVTGYARNLDDGRVEVYAAGPRNAVDELARMLRQGPRWRLNVWLLLVFLANAAVSVMYFAGSRFRTPVDGFAMIWAVMGMGVLATKCQQAVRRQVNGRAGAIVVTEAGLSGHRNAGRHPQRHYRIMGSLRARAIRQKPR